MKTGKRTYLLVVVPLLLIMLLTQTGVSLVTSQVLISSSGTISQITGISPLHVDGANIKDTSGNIVALRGVNKHGFEDDPAGSWQRTDGGVTYGSFDASIVTDNFEAMRSWGINCVRMYSTVEFWVDNTGNHRQIVKDTAKLAAEQGIYLVYSFWHITKDSNMPDAPYLPYCENNDYLSSTSDFVALWKSIAMELKDYPNIIFELWNEPRGDQQTWFNTAQQCINAIRETGATNLITVEWHWGMDANLSYPNSPLGTLSWITQYPLTDSTANIIYSVHNYRGDIYYSDTTPRLNSYNYSDLQSGFTFALYNYTTSILKKPLIVGEIGANMWQTGAEYQHELDYLRNSLTIFNGWGLNYCGFWWWPTGQYALLKSGPNYQPNDAGAILKSAISIG